MPQAWLTMLGLLPLSLALPVFAQSSYTMTVLGKPGSAKGIVPMALDAQGVVHGGAIFSAGFLFTNGGSGSCWVCAQFTQRQVTWPAGTGGTATGVLGTDGFVTVGVGDQGLLVGGYELRKLANTKLSNPTSNYTPVSVPNTAFQLMRQVANGEVSLLSQGQRSTLPLPPEAMTSMMYPYAFEVTAIGFHDTVVVNRTGTDLTRPRAPFLLANGQYTPLDTSVAAPGESTVATAINAQGVVVGHTVVYPGEQSEYDAGTVNPVRWTVGGRAERLPGTGLTGWLPVAINTPGQVLLQKAMGFTEYRGRPTQAAVWFNGSKTDIPNGFNQANYATAISDNGTVVGCKTALSGGGTDTPFLWRNGQMMDLEAHVTARGVKLPTGTKLGCPRAMNAAGSILTFYYKPSAPGAWTWVRLNAQP
jgi:probable HAF family extracellular repeat protein